MAGNRFMWRYFKKPFSVPTFSDPDLNLAARWLQISLWILTGALVFSITILPWSELPRWRINVFFNLDVICLIVNVGAWLLLRRGHVRLAASLLFVILFLLVSYVNLAVYQTIHSPDTAAYFAFTPLAHLLLGKRGMNLVALYSVILICMTFYLERAGGILPPSNTPASWGDLFVLLTTVLVATIVLNAVTQRLEENTKLIQQTALALERSNKDLHASQVQLQQARAVLEDRVQQRTKELQRANFYLQSEAAERQRTVEALRKSEANWRSLVENMTEVIATLDHGGNIVFINRAVGGRAPEAMIGQRATYFHTRSQYQSIMKRSIAQVLQTSVSVSYESEESSGNGVQWRLNRIGAVVEDQQVAALILISTDITEQKQIQAAMHQSQKLESLGMLAGGVAHDFNNLLTAMLVQLSSALVKLSPDHALRRNLQSAMKAAERATDLTRQMLNYAGRTSSENKPVDLNDLITDNIHLFSTAVPKNIALVSDLSATIPLLQGDKGKLQQLLMNLILNSADAIAPNQGTITVTTSRYRLDTDETHYWRWTGTPLAPDDYIKLTVSDTGAGMDANTLVKIFDPFFTTKFTGRGLGLASVLGIVRGHKGGLHVTSGVGKGTSFSILFPLLHEMPTTGESFAVHGPITLVDALVLVIDDEDEVREATSEILREAGLQIITASDGRAGIQLFRERMQEIKLVLLDLAMPGMNGADVLVELKALDPDIPVILISGYAEEAVMERFVDKGLAGFIQKPYSMESLLQRIEQQLQTPSILPAHNGMA
jgi:PAS domain S-box-containing protein